MNGHGSKLGRMGARLLAVMLAVLLCTAAGGQASPVAYSQEGVSVEPEGVVLDGTFFYQGVLKKDGAPVNGVCDFQWALYDSLDASDALDGMSTLNVEVVDGLFQAGLSFPGGFNGNDRWLGISVRCPAGTGTWADLLPRQWLMPTPYANHALHASALYAPDGDPANAVYVDSKGYVGIGTSAPGSMLDVRGNVASNGVFGFSNVTQTTTSYGVYISAPAAQSMALVSNFVERVRIAADGNVGIGTKAPTQRLHVIGGRIRLENAGKTLDLRADGSAVDIQSSSPLWINNITGQPTYINPGAGNVGIGTTSPLAKLDVAGSTRTDVLQIDAGADLAEPFAIAGEPEPGLVVAIDPDHAGQLRIADQPYDRMVAGVVSGAGGLRPGLTMQQPEIVAGEAHPVALTGRVYVWADASFGAIQPGDLLTTSATPGHAMKVSDYQRAQGAVLGKAMTRLGDGRGLVLVLVTLQ